MEAKVKEILSRVSSGIGTEEDKKFVESLGDSEFRSLLKEFYKSDVEVEWGDDFVLDTVDKISNYSCEDEINNEREVVTVNTPYKKLDLIKKVEGVISKKIKARSYIRKRSKSANKTSELEH